MRTARIKHVSLHMTTFAQPSVQSLLIEMHFNEELLSTGTAFVSLGCNGKHYLITARHNVTGRNQVTNKPLSKTGGLPNKIAVHHNSKAGLGEWVKKVEQLVNADGQPAWIEHPQHGSRADFVALPLVDLEGIELFPYDCFNAGTPILLAPAEAISVIGFPFGITAGGFFAVWATGFLASEPALNFSDLPIQLIDCRSRQGQSGAPVVAYRHGVGYTTTQGSIINNGVPAQRFLGVYSGRVNDESDLGFVWKVEAIAELLRSV
jgi:hypothetical protein